MLRPSVDLLSTHSQARTNAPLLLNTDEPIDLDKIDLSKQRVKVLKKILSEEFGDSCKGCLEKTDFIKRIQELKASRHDEM